MNQIQKLQFRNIDDFLEYLPETELKLVQALRKIVLDCIPFAQEKLAYNVPFYYRHTRICFIWPATVPWGAVAQGVALGFCRGNLLSDEIYFLEKGSRHEVYCKVFTDVREIDTDLLKAYLFEAVEIDDQLHRQKKARKK